MRSFTLIEMLVSIGIIMILFAMLLVAPTRTTQTYKLDNAVQRLVSDFQRIQAFALAIADFGGSPVEGGWGIYLKEDEICYLLFADLDKDKIYDAPAGALCDPTKIGGELFERVFLPQSVSFKTGSFIPALLPPQMTIVFKPPHPTLFLNENDWLTIVVTTPSASVTLLTSATGRQKTVTVNAVGNVSVN